LDESNMLAGKTAVGLVVVLAVMAAMMFIPAHTFHYWQAWVFLCVYAICNVLVVTYLWKTDQALLKRRMSGGPFAEGTPAQKIVMALASVGFVALLIVPALDHRLGWSNAPPAVAFIGDGLVVFGFVAATLIFRENTFAAATIQIADEQRVVSTGPYAIVRHPMYAGGLVLLAGIPLALGSYWGLIAIAGLIPVIIWRLLDEEAFLSKNLAGYDAYRSKVRWRLIPRIF
jgi:protein-S-isoprenylcysteine O-methyltransferase Ste14